MSSGVISICPLGSCIEGFWGHVYALCGVICTGSCTHVLWSHTCIQGHSKGPESPLYFWSQKFPKMYPPGSSAKGRIWKLKTRLEDIVESADKKSASHPPTVSSQLAKLEGETADLLARNTSLQWRTHIVQIMNSLSYKKPAKYAGLVWQILIFWF